MLCFTLTVYEEKRIIRELWVVQADGTGPKMLFSEEIDSQFQVFQPEYTNQPFFDADDERIIFTATDKGVPNIVAVSIKDGTLHRLTTTGAVYPALLPEEGAIYYTSLEGNTEELWVMNSDGTGKHRFEIKAASPEKKETSAAASGSVQEADKPAGQVKETTSIKQEPAKKKAPVKKKKPAKKKATEAK
jgi:Tol biopolymer transport system component